MPISRTHRADEARTVRLPRTMPDGKETKKHPLVWCVEHKLGERTKSALADHMGVRPQTLFTWVAYCRRDRNFLLPLERAFQIGSFFGVEASLFRPDILESKQ